MLPVPVAICSAEAGLSSQQFTICCAHLPATPSAVLNVFPKSLQLSARKGNRSSHAVLDIQCCTMNTSQAAPQHHECSHWHCAQELIA